MLFNSYVFILAFLPVVWVLYFGLNKLKWYKAATWALVLASLFFYGFNNWKFCLVLIASIVVNFVLHRVLLYLEQGRKFILVLGLAANVGLLFYIKYTDFFLENVNALFGLSFPMQNILLPLGISFYTFQQLSFVVDSYRKDTQKYSFGEYALFVSFFPQLIAGPIVLHSDMVPQFRDMARRKINAANIYDGLQYFTLGLAKKVLVADTFGRAVDWGYSNIMELNALSAIVLILGYTIQIYFDFSGYCDMAMGLGKLFNFDIAINFNSPYKAKSVGEFWDRWHMTLTKFFTTYVYIPLGGSRKGLTRTCINTMIVFFISGFWHGADWTFVVWGVMHGVFLVLERLFAKPLAKVPGFIKWLYTFCFVNFAWVFFRADFFRQVLSVFKRALLGEGGSVVLEMRQEFAGEGLNNLLSQVQGMGNVTDMWNQIAIWLWFGVVSIIMFFGKNTHEIVGQKKTSSLYIYGLAVLALLSMISLADVSKFLYFNF